MKTVFTSLVILLMSACTPSIDYNYVKSKVWSYDGGFKIGKGDFLLFDQKDKLFDLKSDTI